MASQLKSIMNS